MDEFSRSRRHKPPNRARQEPPRQSPLGPSPRNERHQRDTAPGTRPRRRGRPGWLRRNSKQRRPRYVLWLLAILIAEIIVVGLNDPRFNLARIDVRGNKVLTAEQVIRRSRLRLGTNLFRARLKAARAKLLELPAVAGVTLHRRPPGRVVIRVRERKPLACVAAANALVTIDSGGLAFRVDPSPPRGLPLVAGLEGTVLRPGHGLNPPLASALRECLAAARQASPRQRLTRVSIDQNGNLCFNKGDAGYEVRLGPPEQLSEKMALLTALERSLPDIGRDCEYIDLSCLEAPAWKPKQVSLAHSAAPGASEPAEATEDTPHGSSGRFAQD